MRGGKERSTHLVSVVEVLHDPSHLGHMCILNGTYGKLGIGSRRDMFGIQTLNLGEAVSPQQTTVRKLHKLPSDSIVGQHIHIPLQTMDNFLNMEAR